MKWKKILLLSFFVCLIFFITPKITHAADFLPDWANISKLSSSITDGLVGSAVDMALSVVAWLSSIILKIVAFFTGLAGYVFERILTLTVLEMANNIKINDPTSFINLGWTVLRDIVNIMFIFVLLAAGIMTIIGGFESGTSKKVATVIVVALLLNFSLFFTKIVIDASNIIAVNFYDSIKNASSEGSSNWMGVASVFLEKAQLSSIYSTANTQPSGKDPNEQIILTNIYGSIVMFVLMIILFIMSILFIVRYVALIFVLIASSAAIGSWILPSLKKSIWDKWWSALIGQAFFAPIFIFFLYLSIEFLKISVQTSNITWRGVFENPERFIFDNVNIFINYFLVVATLIGSIIVSKQLSNMAGSGAGKATALIGGAALGVTGFAGRRIGGGIGNSITQSKTLQNLSQSENKWVRGFGLHKIGRGTMLAGNAMKKGSWDIRNAYGVSTVIGQSGVDLGKASDNTYDKGIDKAKKKLEERKKLYGYKDSKASDIDTDSEEFKNELAKDEKNSLKRQTAEKAITDLKDNINAAEKEIAKLDARLKVAVENKDEKLAETIAETMATIKEQVKDKQESLKINQEEFKTINQMIQTRVAAGKSDYLNQKSSAWFSQMKKEAAKRIIEDQKKTKTDFDKLLKEIQEKKNS